MALHSRSASKLRFWLVRITVSRPNVFLHKNNSRTADVFVTFVAGIVGGSTNC